MTNSSFIGQARRVQSAHAKFSCIPRAKDNSLLRKNNLDCVLDSQISVGNQGCDLADTKDKPNSKEKRTWSAKCSRNQGSKGTLKPKPIVFGFSPTVDNAVKTDFSNGSQEILCQTEQGATDPSSQSHLPGSSKFVLEDDNNKRCIREKSNPSPIRSLKKRPFSAPVSNGDTSVFNSEAEDASPKTKSFLEPVVVSCKTGEQVCGPDPSDLSSTQEEGAWGTGCPLTGKSSRKWDDLEGMTIDDLIDYDDDFDEDSFGR